MQNQTLKKMAGLWPHALILLFFALLSAAYFSPVLQGKDIQQMDFTHVIGADHELVEYEKATGETAQWTDAMFGGMPAYQIRADNSHNIFTHLTRYIRLGMPYRTIAIMFLYLAGFYFMMISLGAGRKVSAIGAVAFALGTYNIIIIAVGHITKCYAIAMMPLVIGGVVMTYRGKWLAGGLFTMVSLGLELAFNHIQITYYLGIALLILLAGELWVAIRDKRLRQFGIGTAVLAAAVLLSVMPSATNLWTTYEYGAYSIRGASELKSADGTKQSSGLDKDYALSWSYGKKETPTLLIPNVVGGASEPIGDAAGKVKDLHDPQIIDAVSRQSSYWGGRGFTSGPVYVGAIICFLFFLGCFYYEGRLKWWLIAATVASIMLAWGKNFSLLTDPMFDYFPLYNKFRTVEMALVIATVTIPTLGMLGLKALCDHPEDIKYHPGKFFGAMGLTAGVALILAAVPTLFYDFITPEESASLAGLKAQNPVYGLLEKGMIDARIGIMRADALRSAVLIILASGALWFFSVRKISSKIMLATVGILTVIDLWGVDRRYLSTDMFKSKSETVNTFAMQTADKVILADKTPHRVMALYCNPFNEVYTSYFHHSVGGYHGAKLRRYQDVIDRYLAPDWQRITAAMQKQDYAGIDAALSESNALAMLNCRYLIYNPQQQPLVNQYSMPEAWFVPTAKRCADPDEAIDLIGKIDIRRECVVEDAEGGEFETDSAAWVRQTSYTPNSVSYECGSAHDGMAVFSEIYYPAGWRATIDGKEAEIVRANYILRALRIPAGNHKIEFTFSPSSYRIGNVISTVASVVVALLTVCGCAVLIIGKRRRGGQTAEVERE